MFCDELQIKLIAGKGGNGCVSFRREKFVPKGGPNGGDGGKGGDIVFRANENINTLSHLASKKIYKAQSGENGRSSNMYGKGGEDLILEVPVGTIIRGNDEIIADLSEANSKVKIARGGKGGLGNTHFKSSTHQIPRFAELGEPGEEFDVTLELKLVADVGIIGLPSAGKSTLISVISSAKPKIADYPFTTLVPNLGVVKNDSADFVVCDIPGLIEGASLGKGLGHQFLRHISRTKILVHLIDVYLENPAKNYKTIRKELENYSKELSKKPEIVVLNKIDLIDEKQLKKQINNLKKTLPKAKIFTISAATHNGLNPLLYEISKKIKSIKVKPKPKSIPILRPHLTKATYRLDQISEENEQKIFHVSGDRVDQLVIMTDLNNIEGLERIYHYLEQSGIYKLLHKNGIEVGDLIQIKGKNIPYRP